MLRTSQSRIRPRRTRGRAAIDTTVYPIAMVVVLTVTLVLLMVLTAHR
ncbi:MAG TPA: hypothetical protein VM912_18530 [Terriglobales bacterium]|nr:hypothetical protein [Terriglobales bacterium]